MDTIIRLIVGRGSRSPRKRNTNSINTSAPHARAPSTSTPTIDSPTVTRTPPIDIPEGRVREDMLAIMFPHLVTKKQYVVHPAGLVMESGEIGRRKWEREALKASKRRYEMAMKGQWEMEVRNAMRGIDVW
ncbi:MAG: hypothetical protein Q9209_006695 [Squamulea sp. 1 TL-2023]